MLPKKEKASDVLSSPKSCQVDKAIQRLLSDAHSGSYQMNLGKFGETILNACDANEDNLANIGKAALLSLLHNDANALCEALTGWSAEDLLKKAKLLHDYDHVFYGQVNNEATAYSILRIPTSIEWDKMMDICEEKDTLTHWKNMFSWVNDGEVHELKESSHAYRGSVSARYWYYSSASLRYPYLGFRPAFDNLTTDVSATKVIGTLYMDGFPIQVPCNPTDGGDIPDYIPGTKLEMREPLDDPRYQVRAIRVDNAYIADRVLLKNISYEDIVTAIATRED